MFEIDYGRQEQDATQLIQSGQAINVEFAFCRREGNVVYPLHRFVFCRDYLLDILVWSSCPDLKRPRVYGFTFRGNIDPKNSQLCVRSNREELVFSEKAFKAFFEKVGEDLPVYEFSGSFLWVVVPEKWMKSTALLSIFTYITRLCFLPEKYLSKSNYDVIKTVLDIKSNSNPFWGEQYLLVSLTTTKYVTDRGGLYEVFKSLLAKDYKKCWIFYDLNPKGSITTACHSFNGWQAIIKYSQYVSL